MGNLRHYVKIASGLGYMAEVYREGITVVNKIKKMLEERGASIEDIRSQIEAIEVHSTRSMQVPKGIH